MMEIIYFNLVRTKTWAIQKPFLAYIYIVLSELYSHKVQEACSERARH